MAFVTGSKQYRDMTQGDDRIRSYEEDCGCVALPKLVMVMLAEKLGFDKWVVCGYRRLSSILPA